MFAKSYQGSNIVLSSYIFSSKSEFSLLILNNLMSVTLSKSQLLRNISTGAEICSIALLSEICLRKGPVGLLSASLFNCCIATTQTLRLRATCFIFLIAALSWSFFSRHSASIIHSQSMNITSAHWSAIWFITETMSSMKKQSVARIMLFTTFLASSQYCLIF